MIGISDALLLEVAGIAASLLGFFVVGVFFYVQRGLFPTAGDRAQRYLHAATRTVIVLYAMTLWLALALVALPPATVAALYLTMSIVLMWTVGRTSHAIHDLHQLLRVRVMSRSVMWAAAGAVIVLPWALGGISPSRADLTAAIALCGVFAFTSSASLVLSTFEISRMEEASIRGGPGEGRTPSEGVSLSADTDPRSGPHSEMEHQPKARSSDVLPQVQRDALSADVIPRDKG